MSFAAKNESGGDATPQAISEITRRAIFDELIVGKFSWSGKMEESDFLARLYDLEKIPSCDHRFKTASGDIWQHRVNNPTDWPDDWILKDSRFDLLHCPDETFLRFLAENLHPIVRPDSKDVQAVLSIFNKHLAMDGWELFAANRISGRPLFAARRLCVTVAGIQSVKSVGAELNAEYINQQITRMETSIQSDPELAIGTAKELVETICKTILHEVGETLSGNETLPQLVKKVREKLALVPDNVPERAKGADCIKRLLSNLGTVAEGLAELRSLYGSGHGKHAGVKGLEPRHAQLAVGAAITLSVFLFQTYQQRKVTKKPAKV